MASALKLSTWNPSETILTCTAPEGGKPHLVGQCTDKRDSIPWMRSCGHIVRRILERNFSRVGII